jgi:DNA phosphorothioation-dependent restriction protein DptG
MNNIERLKEELNYWQNEFKPVNNMGKWSTQVRVDSINKALQAAEKAESENETEDSMTDELLQTIQWHDYSYMYSDDDRYWKAGSESEKRIKELVHALVAVFRVDGEALLTECLDTVPEQYVDGHTHKCIKSWFSNYIINK